MSIKLSFNKVNALAIIDLLEKTGQDITYTMMGNTSSEMVDIELR